MSYTDFMEAYSDIISKACRKLKDNRFAVFVVGDIRDNKGAYRGFINDTIRIFQNNGLCLYNEAILLNAYGTAAFRAGSTFSAKKKLTKVHQNVLVFYKGDINAIKDVYSNEFEKVDLSRF